MIESLPVGQIVDEAKTALKIPVGGYDLDLETVTAVDGMLEILFRWEAGGLLGVKIPYPDTTGHPSWVAWAPLTIEEWAMYAVRERLIEELLTGAWLRANQRFDGKVAWLEADLGPGT